MDVPGDAVPSPTAAEVAQTALAPAVAPAEATGAAPAEAPAAAPAETAALECVAVAAPAEMSVAPAASVDRLLDEAEEALGALDWTRLVTRKRRNVMPDGEVEAHTIVLGIHPADGEQSHWMDRADLRAVYDKLAAVMKAHDASFEWHSVQLNKNLATKAHCDRGNRSPSCIVTLGDFTGGRLRLWPGKGSGGAPVSHDVKRRFLTFDGAARLHETETFTGTRYAAVFFSGGRDGKWAADASAEEICEDPLFQSLDAQARESLRKVLADRATQGDRKAFSRVLAMANGGEPPVRVTKLRGSFKMRDASWGNPTRW